MAAQERFYILSFSCLVGLLIAVLIRAVRRRQRLKFSLRFLACVELANSVAVYGGARTIRPRWSGNGNARLRGKSSRTETGHPESRTNNQKSGQS